jgi:FkbM family methyltransferase
MVFSMERRIPTLSAVFLAVVLGLACSEPSVPSSASDASHAAHPSDPGRGATLDAAAREAILEEESLYSQFNEEIITRHFFGDERGGVFLDVGAYHWRDFSTTYYLEQKLGWSGIAIDALEGLRPSYEKNRKNTRFFAYIVTDHSGTEETLYSAGPISSTTEHHVNDVQDYYDDKTAADHPSQSEADNIRAWWGSLEARMDDGRVPRLTSDMAVAVTVPTITLNELLDANGVERIDLLSMDIEQGEPAALAGFDIKRFRPRLVCIEAFGPAKEQIAAYFEENDYVRIHRYDALDHLNWYYQPADDAR